MKTYLVRVMTIFAMVAVLAPVCAMAQDDDDDRNWFGISRGILRQGMTPYTLRAIEAAPGLAAPGTTKSAVSQALFALASVGANTVCFPLEGIAPDGKSVSPEGVKGAKQIIADTANRRMGAICRIFGPDASKDKAYRLAAVEAVGAAFAKERSVIFLIDGEQAGELAAAFKKAASSAVVAAPEGGDIQIVASEPEKAEGAVLLMGALPKDVKGKTHFLMPAGDASYKAVDAFMASPLESQPWTPDNSVLSPEEQAEGFIALFDGKTLNGWWMSGTNQEGFAVKDGTIAWMKPGGGVLYTHDRYSNFVLRFDWKINQNGNSGVFVRAPRTGRCSRIGMEVQIMGDAGATPDIHTTGAVYDVLAPKVNAGKPAGEWNSYEITLNGPQMKVVLNGQVVQDLNLDDTPELKIRLREGFIGLQDHGHPASFRNIRIKKL